MLNKIQSLFFEEAQTSSSFVTAFYMTGDAWFVWCVLAVATWFVYSPKSRVALVLAAIEWSLVFVYTIFAWGTIITNDNVFFRESDSMKYINSEHERILNLIENGALNELTTKN